MSGPHPLESDTGPGDVRGAASAAPRTTPLKIVSAAVAGDDLQSVAASASEALGRPVAIALPALGAPIVWPVEMTGPPTLGDLTEHARSLITGRPGGAPAGVADVVPVRIGADVVGLVAALGGEPFAGEQRAWLEAAANAAAVGALMRESHDADLESAQRAFVLALAARAPSDPGALIASARRLGFDLRPGAVAICARGDGTPPGLADAISAETDGGVLALLPAAVDAEAVAAMLRSHGMTVAVSAQRREPAAFHDALREATLLVELSERPDVLTGGQDETYRLLIGVLLRDPGELEQLRAKTISPLASYDSEHDTDLLATLQAFLAHHGSTTETAEAMHLHRHTVGYRLTRVHEVSGLSPYESDGRERLSLGLKAHHILEADKARPPAE
jgi:sugar diacid utilization regulator